MTRAQPEAFAPAIGGEVAPRDAVPPRSIAIYEIDSSDVLASDAWSAAVERGRWGSEARPHTSNRTHALYRVR